MAEEVNNNRYIYNSFGLVISSDIIIPEFLQGKGEGDISIVLGKVPDTIEGIVEEHIDYKISKTEFIFSVDKVGKYYVKQGKLIIVEPEDGADDDSVKVYLVGTAIGAALLQRGLLPIHGSSVIFDEQAVIFTGNSGAGKSTICAALRKRGYEFLGDDISVVIVDENNIPFVQSSFPQQRLMGDTAEVMGYDKSELVLACKADDKYVISDTNNFKEGSTKLTAIFELSTKPEGKLEVSEITGTEKLRKIISNIYYISILKRLGIKEDYFKRCLIVAKNIRFYKIVRPAHKLTVDEQIEKVQMILKS